tara:strand:+ start:294 stop:500 length:207 start_codon:yes stop_codon:yes gene_type:complete
MTAGNSNVSKYKNTTNVAFLGLFNKKKRTNNDTNTNTNAIDFKEGMKTIKRGRVSTGTAEALKMLEDY